MLGRERTGRPKGRPSRRLIAAVGLAVALIAAVGVASAAENVDLVNPNVRLSDNFYPCPNQTDFSQPPQVTDCLDPASNYQPRQPLVVDAGQTSCAQNGTSTIRVQQRTGAAFIPGAFQGGWVQGTVTWDLTATIDAQTGPAAPNVQPFPDDGARMESFGLNTGALTSIQGTFTINPDNSSEDIVGSVSLSPNAGNWGVCRTFFQEPATGSNLGGGVAPVTGDVYVVNAGVLTYEVTAGPADLLGETGIAEAYFSNSFVTCCGAQNPPTQVVNATGHFRQQFGTTHAAESTSGTAFTPTGSDVTVTNFVGLGEDVGGVSLTFDTVTTAGDTSVTLLTSMPDQPSGFQLGDPPAVYEISTEAAYTAPVLVCLPYGSLPAGVTPQIQHYENGGWVPVLTTSDSGLPDQIICGEVDSLSPFAVGYYPFNVSGPFQPVDAQPIENVAVAGRTIPVRFSLGGDFGLDVIADGYPSFVSTACSSGPTDTVEWTANNAAGLTYDPASGVYTYHWKTLKAWKGTCGTLTIQFLDGSELKADFRFK
jgi:hypothetical protein